MVVGLRTRFHLQKGGSDTVKQQLALQIIRVEDKVVNIYYNNRSKLTQLPLREKGYFL